jgi:GTP-binding protein
MGNLMPEIIKAYENNRKYLNDGQINTCIEDAYAMHAAPSYKGKRLKIYNVHQSANEPPKFTFDVNSKNLVHFSYERYLENCLRKAFDLTGTPIILQFKNHNE